MTIKEAVILVGGEGTRLRPLIQNVPKPMAPIHGVPFLSYILNFLRTKGLKKIILACGYKAEIIKTHFGNRFNDIEIRYSIETEPMGTGGAMKKAFQLVDGDYSFVLNGDTFFDIDYTLLAEKSRETDAHVVLGLKKNRNQGRYGTIQIDSQGLVLSFKEKKNISSGLINGGVYLIKKNDFILLDTPKIFSFEKDILEKKSNLNLFYGVPGEGYFIDIGIPEDYIKAQDELGRGQEGV